MDDIDPTAAAPPSPVDQLVERWWEEHFPGSAVARDTAAWNVAHAAKEMLKLLLAQGRSQAQCLPPATAGAKLGREDLQGSI
jgi:hypothetical protein